ncbi:MAG: flagellar FlbD family protein [Planctomycetota bacterium]
MIKLSRLDGEPFVLNAELIRYVEARPDTFITLTSGERVVVAETMDEVLLRAVTYQQKKHLIPAPARSARDAIGPPPEGTECARHDHERHQ